MRAFLEWTAWPMQPPPSYGVLQISFVIAGVCVAFLAAFLLRNTTKKQSRWIVFGVGAVLLVSELYKQLFHYYVVNNSVYDWWIFPFQLCSIPMYLCLVAPFLKAGNLQQTLYDFLCSFTLLGGFIVFLDPSGLQHNYWTLSLHSFVWHFLLVFVGLLVGYTRLGALQKGGFKRAIWLYVACCVIAFTLNLSLWDISHGSINMFYLGPQPSTQFVFGAITKRLGWQLNTLVYVASTILGALLVYRPFYRRNCINS